MALLVQYTQRGMDLRRHCRKVQCMEHRNIMDQSRACIGRPVERMHMDYIKFGAATLQLQEKIEKKVCLGKEACIGGPFAGFFRKNNWLYIVRHPNGPDINAPHERIVSSEERPIMPPLPESLPKVCHEGPCSSQIRLGNHRY